MSDKTKIEWTDATWNPIRGCSRISEGCRNCYAETVAKRFSGEGMPYHGLIAKTGQWNGNVHVIDSVMTQPLRWKRPRRIFVNSMSDLFHENLDIRDIARVFAVMQLAHWHTFQVLTKRPERMQAVVMDNHFYRMVLTAAYELIGCFPKLNIGTIAPENIPAPNIWLGVSIEDQATADQRIPLLLQTPAAVRWVSAEPLLGPVFLGTHNLDWVVVGGESGKGARPMHTRWVRRIQQWCQAVDVPFLFKQWGEWCPDASVVDHAPQIMHTFADWNVTYRVGKKAAGRLLYGREWNEFPS